MRVLHVLGGDLTKGAHRGAYWLHKGLLKLGVRSVLLGPIPRTQASDAVLSTSATHAGRLLDDAIRYSTIPLLSLYGDRLHLPFSTGLLGRRLQDHPAVIDADIINIHWIAKGPLSIRSIGQFRKPVVWTLRDMWPFTGGCHVALDCKGYRDKCGSCPQLGSKRERDMSRIGWRLKKHYYPTEMTVVGISSWISQCARESSLLGNQRIVTIPNCIDTEVFFPIPQASAREVLGIPRDGKVILAGAESLGSSWKGPDLLEDALQKMDGTTFTLLLFGGGSPNVERGSNSVRHLGYLGDIAMRAAYSAADVFVAPSRQESFGKTLAEAMACGTPVVAFDATGPKDIVLHRRTGYLATPFDTMDLANGISWVLDNADRDEVRRACWEHASSRFSKETIAAQYLELYQDLLMGTRARDPHDPARNEGSEEFLLGSNVDGICKAIP